MVRPHFSDCQSGRSSDIRTIRPDRLDNLDGRSELIVRIVKLRLQLDCQSRPSKVGVGRFKGLDGLWTVKRALFWTVRTIKFPA